MYASFYKNLGKKVLSVDSNRADFGNYFSRFNQFGFSMSYAPDGKTALDMLSRSEFDAIVSDLSLPDMSGKDFFLESSKFRRRGKVSFIYLASKPKKEEVKELVWLGADAFIRKEDLARPKYKGGLAYAIEDLERRKLARSFDIAEVLFIGDRKDKKMNECIQLLNEARQPVYFHQMKPEHYMLTSDAVKNYISLLNDDPTSVDEELGIENVLKTIAKNSVRVVVLADESPVLGQTIKMFFPYVSVMSDLFNRKTPRMIIESVREKKAEWSLKKNSMRNKSKSDLVIVGGPSGGGKTTIGDIAVHEMEPTSRLIKRDCGRDPRLFEPNGKDKNFRPDPDIRKGCVFYCTHKDGSLIGVQKSELDRAHLTRTTGSIPLPSPEAIDSASRALTEEGYTEQKRVIIKARPKYLEDRLEERGGWDPVTGEWVRNLVDPKKVKEDYRQYDDPNLKPDLVIDTITSRNYIHYLLTAKRFADYLHQIRFGKSIDSVAKEF